MKTFIVFAVSLLVTYFAIPLLRKLALRFEIVDYPGGRKVHKQVTPLLGGVGVFLGLIIGLIFYSSDLRSFLIILIGASMIFLIGLVEDIRGLKAQTRFILQLIAAVIVISNGIRVSFMPETILGDIAEILITCIWIIGVTNAYNYLDGLDGLAAGSAVINLFFFGVILYNTGQFPTGLLAVALIGACLGFLPYNFRKEKIFLGEAGSTLLGFTLACLSIEGHWAQDNLVKLFIPVLVLGVPIFDMIFTTIMRIRDGKVKTILQWLQYGGRDHFHHYLVDIGLSPFWAVVFIYFITASLGIAGFMVSNDSVLEGLLSLSQAAIIFGVIATIIVVGKRRRSGWMRDKS
ncbi:MAG: MraY family glycosyltransferase [Candidatus Omnitrophica bacterium]|jgi:UDP-GlcNAc:undecaprenyl-phosphate GlcNAc-1-phosphate transferase|nr:MraY family glycosyltransferase [Candidatus Omnitrophota bacterium]MDD5080275.1 MraY family glycosyltransferase [Candidatus Omnitrophota bacterium]